MTAKIVASVLISFLVAAFVGDASAQQCTPAQECGDVNDDAQVSVADALSVLRRAIGLSIDMTCSCNGGEECVIGGVPETGQTSCWDPLDTQAPINPINCAGTGQDGEIRAGYPVQFIDNGDGTITDTHTTLMWEKLSDDGDPLHDYDNASYQWYGAFQKLEQINDAAFAGHTDWRVPNIRELQTLLDYSSTNPGGAPSPFAIFHSGCTPGCTILTCSCTRSSSYWSSTTSQPNPANAWYLSFQNGQSLNTTKTVYNYVRAVRGGHDVILPQ
jgi:hypothetical protein